MNKEIKVDKVEIAGANYIREDLVPKMEGTGLYRVINYAGFDWNVIAEDNESLTLLMKECLKIDGGTKLMAFNEEDDECVWWKDSTIRKYLNNNFLKRLNKDDLLPMTTEIWLQGESSVTKDYVRMLTVEEIFRLPKNILEKNYWYWSLSPRNMNPDGYAYVFIVDVGGYLGNTAVSDFDTSGGAVAPVIKLKRSALTESVR